MDERTDPLTGEALRTDTAARPTGPSAMSRSIHDPSPLVTIAVAAHNAGRYLLPSIRSALEQTYRHVEVIVVDDGSTDGSLSSLEEIHDARLTVVHQDNQGKSVALNRVREIARGEFIAIHDGDDLSHPDRIRRQVDVLRSRPELAACFSRHELVLDGTHFAPRRLALDEAGVAAYIDDMRIPAIDPTGMYRCSLTADLDYDPELRIGQGVDYMLRVGERHPMIVLGDCLYSYRIVAASTTRRSPSETHRYSERVRQRAAQRRGIEFAPTAPPSPTARAQHAFFGHILEATIESAAAGDRRTAARIAWTTAYRARLGLTGLKPAVAAVLPAFVLRRIRPEITPERLERHGAASRRGGVA